MLCLMLALSFSISQNDNLLEHRWSESIMCERRCRAGVVSLFLDGRNHMCKYIQVDYRGNRTTATKLRQRQKVLSLLLDSNVNRTKELSQQNLKLSQLFTFYSLYVEQRNFKQQWNNEKLFVHFLSLVLSLLPLLFPPTITTIPNYTNIISKEQRMRSNWHT